MLNNYNCLQYILILDSNLLTNLLGGELLSGLKLELDISKFLCLAR